MRRVVTFEEDAEMQRRWAHEEGFRQGIEQGENRLGALVEVLIRADRTSEIERVARDSAYRNQLFDELKL